MSEPADDAPVHPAGGAWICTGFIWKFKECRSVFLVSCRTRKLRLLPEHGGLAATNIKSGSRLRSPRTLTPQLGGTRKGKVLDNSWTIEHQRSSTYFIVHQKLTSARLKPAEYSSFGAVMENNNISNILLPFNKVRRDKKPLGSGGAPVPSCPTPVNQEALGSFPVTGRNVPSKVE